MRGTIEQAQGDLLLIKTREGDEVKLKLAANPGIAAVTKASMADIRVRLLHRRRRDAAARRQPAGHLGAHLLGSHARGSRRPSPWDLRPNSSMTNATVENVVTGVNGQTVTLKYKDGEQKIVIPPDMQIVATCQARLPI